MIINDTALLNREDFRINLNHCRHSVICNMIIEGCSFPTHVDNISVTGICVICHSKNPQPKLGHIYYDCQIILPGVDKINVTLLIRHVNNVYTEGNRQACRCGCKFLYLTSEVERKISTFIHQWERDYLLHRVEVASHFSLNH